LYLFTKGIRSFAVKDLIWRLFKKVFAAYSGRIFFGWGLCKKVFYGASRQIMFLEGLCKKVFYGASRQIIFGWRHLFPDFAKQNQEKDVSIQRMFCRRRRQNTFYTTPKI